MLKRIREGDVHSSDPVEVEAVVLLRSEKPLARSEEREQRIWSALQQAPARRPLLLRPAIVVALLLGVAGVAVATSPGLRRVLGGGHSGDRPAPAEQPARHHAPAQALSLPRTAPEPAPASLPEPVPVPAPRPISRAPRAAAAAPAGESSRQQESALLVRAAHTLNQLHQPAETSHLIDEYFRRFPSGLLQEEALALGIQAAAAQGSPRRVELARKYLARFPGGRFSDLARQQLP